jgi:hypothetical protein
MNKPSKKIEPHTTANFPSASEIAEWKEEHGKIFQFDAAGAPIVIMRKPRLKDIERASASAKQSNKPMMFNKSILTNCTLWQAQEQLTDEQEQAVYSKLDEIILTVEVEVKEL